MIDNASIIREKSGNSLIAIVAGIIKGAADIGLCGVEIDTDHRAPDHVEYLIARLKRLGYNVSEPGFKTIYIDWLEKNPTI